MDGFVQNMPAKIKQYNYSPPKKRKNLHFLQGPSGRKIFCLVTSYEKTSHLVFFAQDLIMAVLRHQLHELPHCLFAHRPEQH